MAGLLAIGALAAAADLFPHGPGRVRTAHGVEVLRPPSARHWLGTDDRGRDVAARLAHGARTSLAVAGGALVLALAAGTAAGAAAALRRGALEATVVAGCDLLGALPALLVAIAVQGLVGRATLATLVVLVAVPHAAHVARLTRAEVGRVLSGPVAEAAHAVGASPAAIVWRHALPLARPQLAVAAAQTVASAVLSEAALTFVGLGAPDGLASWGELLRQAHANGLAWWLALPAGGAVAALALAAGALADEPDWVQLRQL